MIPPSEIAAIVAAVEIEGISAETVARLRVAFPGIHFTHAQDDDVVGTEAAARGSAFKLYLVNAGGGCAQLTADPACATGVVLAEMEED